MNFNVSANSRLPPGGDELMRDRTESLWPCGNSGLGAVKVAVASFTYLRDERKNSESE